jgi:hypothetical protein
MLDLSLARQAATAPQRPLPYRTCPGCRQPLDCDTTNPRISQTRAGEAEWAEPEGYCDRCRRAFFPSVPEPGPWPHRHLPGAAAEDHLRRHRRPFLHPGQYPPARTR